MTGSDPPLAAIRAVPMRCAKCGYATGTERACHERSESRVDHIWETDDAGIARAVRAFVRERMTATKLDRVYYDWNSSDPRDLVANILALLRRTT